MKKLILTAMTGLTLAFSAAVTAPMSAEAADMKIGVVDTQQILTASDFIKVLQKAEQDVMQAEKKLLELRNQKLKELEAAKASKSDDEFLQLKQKFEKELMQQIKKEEQNLEGRKREIQQKKDNLEKNVEAIVQTIAKQKGLDMVINKKLVLFGGTDITQEVVEELKKKMK